MGPSPSIVGHAARGKLHVCQLPRGGHLQYPSGQALGLDRDDDGGQEGGHGGDSVLAQLADHWRLGRYAVS